MSTTSPETCPRENRIYSAGFPNYTLGMPISSINTSIRDFKCLLARLVVKIKLASSVVKSNSVVGFLVTDYMHSDVKCETRLASISLKIGSIVS